MAPKETPAEYAARMGRVAKIDRGRARRYADAARDAAEVAAHAEKLAEASEAVAREAKAASEAAEGT